MNKRKVPKIRFKGFYDDWEQRKLIDLLDQPITDGPHETPNIVDDGIPFISADAIVDNKIDFTRKRGNITEEYDLQCCKKYKPEFQDVYLVKSGSTVGKVAIVETTQRFNIWSPLAAMRCKENSNPYFLFALLQTKENQAQVKDKASNGTQPNLSMRVLEQFDIVSPCSRNEQIKIGEFFNNLDHLITLHQRELEKLKIIKKSMLKTCFPKNGEKAPKIRFSGFSDDWEQRKLLSCIQKITDFRGRTPKKLGMDWSESGYLALSALNVKDGYIDFLQDVHYGDQALYDKWMSGNELHKGQVLFTTEAPMGNIAQVPDNKRYILSQRTIAFDVKESIITENFLAALLRSPVVFNTLTSLSSGGTAKGVSQKSLAGVDIRIPVDLREQTFLATYFRQLDHLITLHQSKLEKLKMIKKSMLETMFV